MHPAEKIMSNVGALRINRIISSQQNSYHEGRMEKSSCKELCVFGLTRRIVPS